MIQGDNQQGTPSEAEIAWLAGIIEGEGSVMLSCFIRKEGGHPKIGTEIKIYNTDAGIIAKAVDIFERLGFAYYLAETKMEPIRKKVGDGIYTGKMDPMLSVAVKNLRDAYNLSKAIYPWMFGDKKLRVALIIQYLARRLAKIDANGGNYRNVQLDYGDCKLVVDFYRNFVSRPGHNGHLVEGLLRDYEQSQPSAA